LSVPPRYQRQVVRPGCFAIMQGTGRCIVWSTHTRAAALVEAHGEGHGQPDAQARSRAAAAAGVEEAPATAPDDGAYLPERLSLLLEGGDHETLRKAAGAARWHARRVRAHGGGRVELRLLGLPRRSVLTALPILVRSMRLSAREHGLEPEVGLQGLPPSDDRLHVVAHAFDTIRLEVELAGLSPDVAGEPVLTAIEALCAEDASVWLDLHLPGGGGAGLTAGCRRLLERTAPDGIDLSLPGCGEPGTDLGWEPLALARDVAELASLLREAGVNLGFPGDLRNPRTETGCPLGRTPLASARNGTLLACPFPARYSPLPAGLAEVGRVADDRVHLHAGPLALWETRTSEPAPRCTACFAALACSRPCRLGAPGPAGSWRAEDDRRCVRTRLLAAWSLLEALEQPEDAEAWLAAPLWDEVLP
jgi:hypothetical protein